LLSTCRKKEKGKKGLSTVLKFKMKPAEGNKQKSNLLELTGKKM
jgi:hypothetical protein